MSQPANWQLPICNRGQLAVGKLTSELIEIPQQSGATNGGATCRLMQLPKFVFVLMKFFPLHKTHSNLTIDEVMLPPLSFSPSFRHIPFGPITQSRSCAGKFMAILLGADNSGESGEGSRGRGRGQNLCGKRSH